jgi:hypothetical protein
LVNSRDNFLQIQALHCEFASEVGILITPWFMNIVLLPKTTMQQKTRVGKTTF